MADNYCQSSTFIKIPSDKLAEAQKIIDRIEEDASHDDEIRYLGFDITCEKDGVWINGEEIFDPDMAEMLIRELVETLDLPGVYICSWAYTCSRPRIGEFGGGAFGVQKSTKTVWIDAVQEVTQILGGINA